MKLLARLFACLAGAFAMPSAGLAQTDWRLQDICDISIAYQGEVFTNARGGISTNDATRYLGLLDLEFDIQLGRLQPHVPGRFYLLAQNAHGEGLTERFTGDGQVISNIDAGRDIAQVSEYWWEFPVGDHSVVRLGKQDVNTEFLFMETAEDFISSPFGLTPALSLPSYPNQTMAAVLLTRLNESWQLKLGVWDAYATGNGWGVSSNLAPFFAGELECDYALGGGAFPGVFAVAAGYVSDDGVDGALSGPSYGFLAQLEQMVWRESLCDASLCDESRCGGGDRQGLSLFASYVPRFFKGVPDTDSLGDTFVAGLTYRGWFANRDGDNFGVGVAWAELFQGGTGEETVVEVFYKAQLTSRLSVQPDVQYIASPSGTQRDALAAGVRVYWTP